LAKFGLFDECYEAINGSEDGKDGIVGSEDEKATYILKEASKTDFAYDLSGILQRQLDERVSDTISVPSEDEKNDSDVYNSAVARARSDFSVDLKSKLPAYIVEAIEYVTAPIGEETSIEEQSDAAFV